MKQLGQHTSLALALFFTSIPIIIWIKHPELTQMQVTFKCWWCIVGLIASGYALGLTIKK